MTSTSHLYLKHPLVSLTGFFVIWKILLFTIALATPGPVYDTSTSLLLQVEAGGADKLDHGASHLLTGLQRRLVERLTRWDAIYFSTLSHRGYVHEQEWAFGFGYTRLVSWIRHLCSFDTTVTDASLVGVCVSTISHVLSVYTLYYLAKSLCHREGKRCIAFLAALLHIVTPAGLFMSAPYGESLFALLNFSGMLCYCSSLRSHSPGTRRDLIYDDWLLIAGVFFGLASTIRSNGIFCGLIFLQDLRQIVRKMLGAGICLRDIHRGFMVVGAGILVGVGFAYPQVVAYLEYCTGEAAGQDRRPWCSQMPPSIYTFVQRFYWNVGFLRYWTISNLPLFALAAPTLVLMLVSSIPLAFTRSAEKTHKDDEKKQVEMQSEAKALSQHCKQRFAVPQLVLTLLALTSFHVQIITRIATAYPLLYIWMAEVTYERKSVRIFGRERQVSKGLIQWMVMYGMIQAGLFASFLPPA